MERPSKAGKRWGSLLSNDIFSEVGQEAGSKNLQARGDPGLNMSGRRRKHLQHLGPHEHLW